MGIRHVLGALALATMGALISTDAWAIPVAGTQPKLPRRIARSVGSPTEGHLVGGARLSEAPYLRIVPAYQPSDARYGLDALVNMLDRGGKAVHKQFPDAVMSVGHLSRQNGGDLSGHHSHESGRDADVGFYMKNKAGKPFYADNFVVFKGDGTAKSAPGVFFDDAKNWALVTAFLRDPEARVSHLFVATPIRARLLAYAERIGASPDIRARAAAVMIQPHGVLPHDDHFHVRLTCPSTMPGCVELPTNSHVRHNSAVARVRTQAHRAATRGPVQHAPAAAGKAPHAGARPQRTRDDEDSSDVGRLAPDVPGLDSVVTGSAMPPTGGGADARVKPQDDSVDDVDGTSN